MPATIDAMGHCEIPARIPTGADRNMSQQKHSATTRASRESRSRPKPTQNGTPIIIKPRNANMMVCIGVAPVIISVMLGHSMQRISTESSIKAVDTAMIDRFGFICSVSFSAD